MKLHGSPSAPAGHTQWLLFCAEGSSLSLPDADLTHLAREAVESGTFKGKEGEIVPILKGEKVGVLCGLGKDPEAVRPRRLSQLTKTALQTRPLDPDKPLTLIPAVDRLEDVRAIVDGALLGLYRWDKYVKPTEETIRYSGYDLTLVTQHVPLVESVATIGEGVNLARNLANENADIADSIFLEKTIREIVESNRRCKITVLNQTDMEEKGLGLILAVNQGSAKEPKLIVVAYRGGAKGDPYTALIGKGITFDSGGLNLKPTGSLETMRMDMSGAAAVIGTLFNTLRLSIRTNVLFACAMAENAISSRSYKPGDVLSSYAGKTVEIGNTDAEGRLVLADANSYVARNYRPESIINIATLTGAVVIALGYEYSGLMASDRSLADALLRAAERTDDRAWELPIFPELKEHVKSEIADIKNIGHPKCAGALAGGEFLRQFAQCDSTELKWAHLDIAGTAKPDQVVGYFDKNATGAGVRLFTQYLLDRAGKA